MGSLKLKFAELKCFFSYVCSKDIKDYKHFSNHGKDGEGCPLHDNIEERHEQEVKKAAEEAISKVKAENPGILDVSA